jgi:hypothetical protein
LLRPCWVSRPADGNPKITELSLGTLSRVSAAASFAARGRTLVRRDSESEEIGRRSNALWCMAHEGAIEAR